MAGKMALYKLVVLGDGGVGKTAMTIQLCLDHFVETYDPTIEDSYRKQVVVDGKSCMLEVLDTAGQEEYTALREEWIRDGEAFLLVYSVTSRSSFTRIRRFHYQVLKVKETPASDFPYASAGAPICLLVGNKSDRVTEREVSTLEGHELADELGCYFVESSAKNHPNTEKAFYDVIRHLRRQRLEAKEAKGTLPKRKLRTQETAGYTVKSRWWGMQVSIPAGEAKSEDGQKRLTRALVNAAKRNRERELVAYLAAGANINGQPGSDGAAIHAAAASGRAKIVNILLKKGAAVNAKGPSGTSPLQIAAAEGHLPVVKLLLSRGAQINQTSQLHGSALSAAASRGRVAVVQFLLQEKANVNVVGGPYGNALQAAAWIGSSAIVEALLGAGADINARGDGDCTALQIAAFAGHANVIRSLLSLGGTYNINAPGGKYGSALKAADDQGHFEAVTVLRKAGAIVIPKSSVNSEPPGVSDGGEAEVAPMTGQTGENTLKTPRTPLKTTASSSLKTGEAETLSLHDQNAKNAVTTPTLSWDSLFSSSAPDLANTLVMDGISRLSAPPLGRAGEKPSIHAVGFSSISDPINATVDIVFVHGLQGHPEKTWSNGPAPVKRRFFRPSSVDLSIPVQKTIFWPYDLLSKHPDFAQARILTWGYDSRVVSEFFGTSDQHNISQYGSDLMVALQQERKRNPFRPLIFVAHSLGGILVKVALDESKRATHQPQYLPIYHSTRAIIFLGTPHGGSGSTNWGLLASNLSKFALQGPSERILKGLRPNNEVLENLRKVFLQMLEDNKFKIHSFFETKPMLGVYGLNDRVVPYESARVGHARQEIVRGIDGNHSEICKFSSATDPGYKAVLGALEDYLLAIKGNPN